MANSPEYEAARATASAAYHVYEPIVEAYRAMEIGDDEYLAARAVYEESQTAFDLASFAERDRAEAAEAEEPVEEDDGQLDLL